MDETKRSFLVGVFMIVALIALGVLVIIFGENPGVLGGKRYRVTAHFDSIVGASQGTRVLMRGITIGEIEKLKLTDPNQPSMGVDAILRIENEFTLPTNAVAQVETSLIGLTGQGMFTILLPDEPKGELPKDDNAKITGKMVSADLLPESTMQIVTEALERISELATALIPVSKNLNLLLEQRPTAQVDSASSQPTQPSDGLPPNVSTAVQRLDMTLKNFNDVIGDPTVKDNLRDFINNLAVAGADLKQIVADLKPLPAQARTFVETGNRMLENLDKTVGNVDIRVNEFAKAGKGIAGQLESVLENVNQITQTIADGKGTAGRLVKDEKLYEALLNTVEQLKETIKEFKVLITKLQAEGLRLL